MPLSEEVKSTADRTEQSGRTNHANLQFPLRDSDLTTISESDIVAACKVAPVLCPETGSVVRVSDNGVDKFSEFLQHVEVRNMQFVAANSSIRLPAIIHSFEYLDTECGLQRPTNISSWNTFMVLCYLKFGLK